MLRFKAPTDTEKEELIEHSIVEYSKDLFRTDEFESEQAALDGSREEVVSYINEEKNPDNDRIYFLYADVMHVGYIWFKLEPEYGISVLLYIYIFPQFRRHGYAYQAMELYEKESLESGAIQTQLVVFLDNPGAIDLYNKCGYVGVEEFTLYGSPIDTRRRMAKMLIELPGIS